MPRSWHDRHEANRIEDEDVREFYRLISADRKPYFMCYIYPALMKQYKKYIKKANEGSMCKFGMNIESMSALPNEKLTDEQKEFLKYYNLFLPVGDGDCVMNKICRRFEEEFDGWVGNASIKEEFDYTILKSDAEYTKSQYYQVMKLYDEYNTRLQKLAMLTNDKRYDANERKKDADVINGYFIEACSLICPNEKMLCDIMLDMCYKKKATKRFAWSICRDTIIENLLEKSKNIISIPQLDPNGDIEYGGERFKIITKELGVNE